ncbi:nucleotide-binding protein, partial [Haloferax marisrubri]
MLAIAGGKGGSGKTTTTLGLASALDGPVLAVDADRDMPNLHAMAGVERPGDAAADGPAGEPSVRAHPTDPTVSVLPAPAG